MQTLHTKLYKKRMSTNFGVLCLFPALTSIAAVPTFFYALFSIGLKNNFLYFLFTFAIPQIFYTILSMVLMLFVPRFINCGIESTVKIDAAPHTDVILFVFSFLGLSTVATYLSSFLTDALTNAGVPIPPLENYIPIPEGTPETIIFLITMALLPAICEEIIFRGIFAGSLKNVNPRMAIILSSLAFGLIHATVQQIPFAFAMGLFLGYAYVRYNSIIPGIIAHFVNNALACVFMLLSERLSEELYASVAVITDISVIIIGTICTVLLFYIIRKHKQENNSDNFSKEPLVSGKEAWKITLSSLSFWAFIAVSAIMTTANILVGYIIY